MVGTAVMPNKTIIPWIHIIIGTARMPLIRFIFSRAIIDQPPSTKLSRRQLKSLLTTVTVSRLIFAGNSIWLPMADTFWINIIKLSYMTIGSATPPSMITTIHRQKQNIQIHITCLLPVPLPI
jgi:hypothetical protein